jgi:maleylpyruvate isomerase
LTWARTGVETPEYPSLAARAEEIEAGSGRDAAALVADVRHSAARFALEYLRMPAEAWHRIVRWTGGRRLPALRAADSRLSEVLVHHVDLRAGYAPNHWPPEFVSEMLSRVAGSLASRDGIAAMRCHAKDTEMRYQIGASGDALVIRGGQASLLAWLMGRSAGGDLSRQGGAALPALPPLF